MAPLQRCLLNRLNPLRPAQAPAAPAALAALAALALFLMQQRKRRLLQLLHLRSPFLLPQQLPLQQKLQNGYLLQQNWPMASRS